MIRFVLDSWAFLAFLQGEPEGEVIKNLFNWQKADKDFKQKVETFFGKKVRKIKLFANIVNLGEVFYIVGRRMGEKQALDAVNGIRAFLDKIIPATEQIVFEAARFKIKYRMSYADGFALATATLLNASLVTGDPDFEEVKEVPIFWLRR